MHTEFWWWILLETDHLNCRQKDEKTELGCVLRRYFETMGGLWNLLRIVSNDGF